MPTLLRTLLTPEIRAPRGSEVLGIAGLTPDSRQVRPGFVFAALSGTKTDGARFIAQAIEKGAVAILAGAAVDVPAAVAVLRADNPRRALALMAARFYSTAPETIVAVTGTNGKTSIAAFARQIWAGLGLEAASLGTIGLIRPSGQVVDSLTTPEPVTLHKLLCELAGEGVTHLSMEASSHGLAQCRLDGVRLSAAAFSNIGHDHLDYHRDAEDYFAQKLRLFRTVLPEGATAVVNADAERSAEVIEAAYGHQLKVMTVGGKGRGIRIESVARDGFRQRIVAHHDGERFAFPLPLIGAFQASNALIAAGLAIASGSPPEGVFAQLPGLVGVSGRLEVIGERDGGIAVVDYAHKPEALATALDALRPFVAGKLICVFGCGGDRDRGKRPMMGRIATEKADAVIVTDDNPRNEQPAAIRAAILAAAPGAVEIGDRGEAIRAGCALLGDGDVLIVAGKGHETGQYLGDTVLPFSDQDEVRAALLRDRGR